VLARCEMARAIRCLSIAVLPFSATVVAGCVQKSDTYLKSFSSPPASTTAPSKSTQSQTINLEAADRIARFKRLATVLGTSPPSVDQVYAPPGSVPGVNSPVPVVRIVFSERSLFDFNSATPRQDAQPTFELIVENMKRDVPDAALTILGHTDAVGSESYNMELSQRRASSVLSRFISNGLNPNQLNTVAIGKSQPIAANSTDQGRALNRRVEFFISGSEQANLAVVADRTINTAFISPEKVSQLQNPPTQTAIVYKPVRKPSSPDDERILGPSGLLVLQAARPAD